MEINYEESGRVGTWIDWMSASSKEVHIKVGVLPLCSSSA